jgi:hypothetical protein
MASGRSEPADTNRVARPPRRTESWACALRLPPQIASNQLSYHSTGYLVAVKLHANAELSSRRIDWLDTYDVA